MPRFVAAFVAFSALVALAPAANAQSLPGAGIASPAYAGAIFAEACLKTRPNYRGAARVLEANGLVKIPTGTFYHTEVNLSVKPVRGTGCSIVFAVRRNPEQAARAFADAVATRVQVAPGDVTVDIARLSADRVYVSARTKP